MNYKDKSTFLNNCLEWLFSKNEREPIGFISIFFMTIIISTGICIFIMGVSK